MALSYRMARRSFLRNCGGSTALLLPLLRGIEARAQGRPAPLRLLIIRHSGGSPLELWRPAEPATTTTYTLPANSAPFAPLQSKMVMVDGLNVVVASPPPYPTLGDRSSEGGTVALMTGVPVLGLIGPQDYVAGGPSIDQLLLDRSPLLGGVGAPPADRTPFGSLQLAADLRSRLDEVAPRVLSYRPPTTNLPLTDTTALAAARNPMRTETKPLNAFVSLFGGALGPSDDPGSALARKVSILAFTRRDLARLSTLVPASEKGKLLIHADAIQKLELALRSAMGSSSGIANPVRQACAQPPTPDFIPQTGLGPEFGNAPAGGSKFTGFDYFTPTDLESHPHQVVGRLHLSLIKAAFSCDLARVATFSWSSGTSWVAFPSTFGGGTVSFPNSPNLGIIGVPHYSPLQTTDPGVVAWWAAIDRFYSEQTSQAIQELDTATDVDGASLLDNTIVVYVSEIARASDHSMANVPFLVFGGRNTRVRGGTFLKVTDGQLPHQTALEASSGTGNRPLNDAWLALASALGVDLPSLGSPAQFSGALPGLFR